MIDFYIIKLIKIIQTDLFLFFLLFIIFLFFLLFIIFLFLYSFESLKNILYLYIGFFIIALILYMRFRERKDHDVLFHYNLIYFIFVSGLLLFYIYIFFLLFKKDIKISPFIQNFKELYDNSLFTITKFFFPYIISYIPFQILATIMEKLQYFKLLYCFLFLLPRFTLAMSLFLDIVILHHMHYLYKFIFLAWIPLSIRVLLYLTWFWSQIFKSHFFDIYEQVTEIFNGEEYTSYYPIEGKESEFVFTTGYYLMHINRVKIFESFYKNLFEVPQLLLFKCFSGFIYLIYIIIWSYVLFQLSISLLILYSFIII